MPGEPFFDRITRPEQLLTALPEAMRVLLDPAETGAVTLSLPQDIQSHAYDYPVSFFEERTWRVDRRPPEARRIAEAAELIKAAERPAIIAGGGVHYSAACAELAEFAARTGIPVGETMAGRGAMRAESEMCLHSFGLTGNPAAYQVICQSDLIISIGTRLADFATGSQSVFHNPDVKFIGINVVGHDAYKQGALPIVADAREALRALVAGLRRCRGNTAGRLSRRDRTGKGHLGQTEAEGGLHADPGRGDEPGAADRHPERRGEAR